MQPRLFFLSCTAGKLLITQFVPVEAPRLNLIVVPPFGEEMNKSRNMLATFARDAASHQIKVSLIDLFGTGDSEGDFSTASWIIWQQNIVTLYRELQREEPAVPVALLGLRTGGLLALDCCFKQKISGPLALMLWQPVLNGQQFINQFLRLRLAAGMLSQQPQSTIGDLEQQMLSAEIIEIAGYALSQLLSEQICALNYLQLEQLPAQLKLGWLEVGLPPTQDLLPISQKVIARWQQHNDISAAFVPGDSFWQTQQITRVSQLVNHSIDYLLACLDE